MADSKKYNGSTWEHSLRKLTTATDTFTTLPADLYADGNSATVGLAGNMAQTGAPTPQNPIQPQETGERTGNLFDKENADVYTNSTLGNINEWAYSPVSTGSVLRIPCNGGVQYTLSIADSISNTVFRISETDTDNVPISGGTGGYIVNTIISAGAIHNYSFTTKATSKYLLFQVNANLTTDTINSLMLNIGSTALPYEPYGYKIPILSANTTTPVYLGEVETTRKIKKLVLDGTENWNENFTNYGYRFGLNVSDSIQSDTMDVRSLCTHLPLTVRGGTGLDVQNVYVISASSDLIIKLSNSDRVSDLKTWLAQQYANGTPVTVWYVLATPTTGIVNEPIRKIGDYTDTVSGITIPTLSTADTFDVQTTLKPSEVSLAYTGWHDASVHEKSRNLFDKSTAISGERILARSVIADATVAHSDYIDVTGISNLAVSHKYTGTNFYFYSDKTNDSIGYVNGYAADVPTGAKYCRINIQIGDLDNTMLNEGSTVLPYEPYWT